MKPKTLFKALGTTVVLVFFLFPFYWSITSSLKPAQDLFAFPAHIIPQSISLTGWQELLLGKGLVMNAFKNSIVNSLTIVGITLAISFPTAYAMSRFRFKGKVISSSLIYFVIVVPGAIVALPLFFATIILGIHNTAPGYTLSYSALTIPTAIWLIKPFIDTVPREMEESAELDGASSLNIITKIIIPLTFHGMAVAALLTFVWSFNDFAIAFMVLTSTEIKTYPILMASVLAFIQWEARWDLITAMATLGALPPILLFYIFQRYFQEGLMKGAFKG